MNSKSHDQIQKLALTALFAALCYVIFTFLQIKIPMPGGDATSLHLGNAFCVLAALLLGGGYGGTGRSCRMDNRRPDGSGLYHRSSQDVLSWSSASVWSPVLVAHKIAHISESTDKKYIFKWSLISSIAGLGFNVIFDPLVGYFYKQYILGQPQEMASVLAKWSTATTFVNAVASTILVVILYNALLPALKKSGLKISSPAWWCEADFTKSGERLRIRLTTL